MERVCHWAIKAVVWYQAALSWRLPNCCRYEPSCSQYCIDALVKYGFLAGIARAVWRLLRCNPLSRGGYDPV
ncbi:MAG: membrane protein insertion efficiency factor YidD [Candidatus Brocadiia bacterium]